MALQARPVPGRHVALPVVLVVSWLLLRRLAGIVQGRGRGGGRRFVAAGGGAVVVVVVALEAAVVEEARG